MDTSLTSPSPTEHSPTKSVDPASLLHKDARAAEIPWRGLIPLILYRVVDASTYLLVFPCITDMMTSFNVSADRVGLYTGLGEGCLMAVEAASAPVWAKLADKYGRKPTLVWGFLLCVIPAAMTGFSTRPWHVMLWRGLFGIIPVGVVGKTMVTEISHPENRVQVFSLYSPGFSMGGMIGTFLGGELAKPYGRLPGWLGGQSTFLRDWPYALPCLVVFAMSLLVTIVGLVFLDETKAPRGCCRMEDRRLRNANIETQGGSYRKTFQVSGFVVITLIFCAFQFTTMSFEGIYSVYTYTPVSDGGLGLPVDRIGLIMACAGLIYIISTPFTMPRLTSRFGNTRALRLVLFIWPFLAISLPLTSHLAGIARPLTWVLILGQLIGKAFGNIAWALCDMLTLSVFDQYPELLATGSAVSLIAGAGGRATGPAGMSWLFSISSQYPAGTWGRSLYWLVYLFFTLPPIVVARFLLVAEKPEEEGYEAVPLTGIESGDMDLEERR